MWHAVWTQDEREVFTWTWLKYASVLHIKLCNGFRTLENFMVFYNVFVAFVGLNNNTIVALQNIEFGWVSSDWYPDPAENANIEVIPILNIGSAPPPPNFKCKIFCFWELNNSTNASNLTSANISKSRSVIHFNTLLP